MANLALVLEYDGAAFHGWQEQPGVRTVQGELRAAASVVCREPVTPVGAGRTDAGVHAEGQVASFHTTARVSPDALRRSVNALVGDDLVVRTARWVADSFHARHSARGRVYRYRLLDAASALHRARAFHPRHPVDLALVLHAGRALIGERDFTSFAAAEDASPSKVCRVHALEWRRWSHGVELVVSADRFLHHMVRNVVGTLLEIGGGRRDPDSLPDLLATRDRRLAGPTAPACALTLLRVEYDASAW